MADPKFEVSRRELLTKSLATLAAAGLPVWFQKQAEAAEYERANSLPRRIGPNDRIVLGCIGPGGKRGGYQQGLNDTRGAANHPGTHVTAVCDLDSVHRAGAAAVFGPDTKQFEFYPELLAMKEIDAVVIGVPDHWHVRVAIAALRAGKDVYCEKPLTLTIDEGKTLVKVAKETGRIFQVGSQQRSDARFRLACTLVRNGRLGKIHTVKTNLPSSSPGGPFPVLPVPDGFNWEMWQGQTPAVDYVKERTHGTFRWWLEYSGGMMTDWGAHHNDIMQWGLGMDESGPITVEATGDKSQPMCNTCYNTFPKFEVKYTYPEDITVICSSAGENGVQFEGDKGWIFVSRGDIRASDPTLLSDPLPSTAVKLYESNDHMGNFLEGIRTRKETICPARVGFHSVAVCHIGNISLRLGGRHLQWDPHKMEFKGDHEANTYLKRKQREPYVVA